mmetsp:Transcript_70403/g.187507  ORF Transcript_70403/g.187507 Transcript_70403/m.187507 type:complete len:232 (-) Transcript_70403:1117-1812(-)
MDAGALIEELLRRKSRCQQGDVRKPRAGCKCHKQGDELEAAHEQQVGRHLQHPRAHRHLAHDDRREHHPEDDPLGAAQVALDGTSHKLGQNQSHGASQHETVVVEVHPEDKSEDEGNEPAQGEIQVVGVTQGVKHVQHGVHRRSEPLIRAGGGQGQGESDQAFPQAGHVIDRKIFFQVFHAEHGDPAFRSASRVRGAEVVGHIPHLPALRSEHLLFLLRDIPVCQRIHNTR